MDEKIRKSISDWVVARANDSQRRTGVFLGQTLELSLGRVLLGVALREGSSIIAIGSVTETQIRHICDWLTVAHQRNEPWLSRLNENGIPFKLAKFGTVEQIVDEANKAMAKRRGDGATRKSHAGGTESVYDAGDGWSIVRLLTPEALDIEGHEMGHCVGQGAYDYGLSKNTVGIYSLRDPYGKSHVTLEIKHSMAELRQIKGKQNKPPKAEYMRRLLGWPDLKDLSVQDTELPPGFAVDRTRGIIELASLNSGEVFEGNIVVELVKGQDNYVIPLQPGVTVKGDVAIMGLKAGELIARLDSYRSMQYPSVSVRAGVTIDGILKMDHVTLESFAAKARKITVRNSTIRSISRLDCLDAEFSNSHFDEQALAKASVSGDFYLRSCPGVVFHRSTGIARMLTVTGCRPIMDQPEKPVEFRSGFSASGLSVYNSIISFGDWFLSHQSLELEATSVRHMPSQLHVRWNLTVDDCIIDRWPEKMIVDHDTLENNVTVSNDATSIERPTWVPKTFAY
ncbi:PcfJ domain-containing protein [Rhizobium sp. BK176]|uniref:PcfJ domain-containing protein n=1 Tax=Rhizobium sp. BK176 TaxID=2587071 RepID=UPI00216A670E|nr:PcfJ domain-containing protein [Rhizobium sp. BK176]MCS4089685.1 hypothetical protein [Rhizobium sp. BK176]